MTWAEFNLRLLSFNRVSKSELIKLRRLAWVSLIAPHQDPKKLRGKREETWWRIGEKRANVTESHKQRFIEEYKKYLEKAKHGRT